MFRVGAHLTSGDSEGQAAEGPEVKETNMAQTPVYLRDADTRYVNLCYANLQGVDLRGVDIGDADPRGTDR